MNIMRNFKYICFTLLVSVFFQNYVFAQSYDGQNSGTFTLNGGTVIVYNQIEIDGTLTITGNGTIKAGAEIKSIFYIKPGGKLELNGKSESERIILDGGAIFESGDGHPFTNEYEEVEITGNKLSHSVIHNENGTLSLSYVTIQNSSAKGIYIRGKNAGEDVPTTISNCIIRNCVAEQGSAMHISNQNFEYNGNAESCKVSVENTVIEYCYAYGDKEGGSGGTIRTNGNAVSNLYLTNVRVQNNYSAGSGGGIYWNAAGTTSTCCTFNGCNFSNNAALGQGGAMMLETTFKFDPNGEVTSIKDNEVLSESGTGGGIVITSYGGGAINPVSDGKYTFTYDLTDKLEISNNSAGAGAGISFNFGTYDLNPDFSAETSNKLETSVTTNINLKGATIKNNEAQKGNGGGIRIFNNTSTWEGNKRTIIYNINVNSGILSENKAKGNGGAIYTYMTDIQNNADRSDVITIKDNEAEGDGGGIYVDGGKSITLAKNSMTGNSAKNGAALYLSGASGMNITLGETTMNSNKALYDGGAIYISGGSLSIAGNTTLESNSANRYGGAAYVSGGNINSATAGINLRLNMNNSEYGGAFYVVDGSIDTKNKNANSELEGNWASLDGGAFYVNNGYINLGTTSMVANGIGASGTITQNGGAIALLDGTFIIGEGSELRGNKALVSGGGLYVFNSDNSSKKTISCNGGDFNGNTAENGGGIFASGYIDFTLAANVNSNTASNGGGIYIENGVNMSFGNGLIVANKAEKKGDNTGRGGGIYISDGNSGSLLSTLAFTNPDNLGIYNNAADYEAADIFASGNNTKINLPNVKKMNLTGFDVPGSELYWVEDKFGKRYEDALKNLNANIEEMILSFEDTEQVKELTDKQCLDLGYDLVFINLISSGLDDGDNAEIIISYNKDGNDSSNDHKYRTVLVSNNTVRVGLPSGKWRFSGSSWAYKYESTFKSDDSYSSPDGFGYCTITRNTPNVGIIYTKKNTESSPKMENVIGKTASKTNKLKP